MLKIVLVLVSGGKVDGELVNIYNLQYTCSRKVGSYLKKNEINFECSKLCGMFGRGGWGIRQLKSRMLV